MKKLFCLSAILILGLNAQAHIGSGGGSLEPCMDYNVGELMSSYSEYNGGASYYVKVYYVGNCEARVEKKYHSGGWVTQPYWITAPCDCGALPSHDLYELDLLGGPGGNNGGGITIGSDKPIFGYEVLDLATGKPYFGSTCEDRGTQELHIPTSGMQEGVFYGVIAYDDRGNAKGFAVFSVQNDRIVEGGFFAMWQDARGSDIQMTCMFFVDKQQLKVFNQHADKTESWAEGVAPVK